MKLEEIKNRIEELNHTESCEGQELLTSKANLEKDLALIYDFPRISKNIFHVPFFRKHCHFKNFLSFIF